VIIQFRDCRTGRKLQRQANLSLGEGDSPGGEFVLVVSGGRVLNAADWTSARGRLVRGTRTERANFAAWLLRGLPHYITD
jgi:hypothetical protein